MDTVLEPQATPEIAQLAPEAETAEKKSFFKRLPKWAMYLVLALIAVVVLALGYTQQWFKVGGDKAKEVLSSVMPTATQKQQAPMEAAAAADVLTKARQAFASGDVQGSINGYKEALAKNPDDVNAMGELGNVLYTTGWIPQATQTYFDAANKALEQNKPEVAEALLPVILESNPMLASQLEDRMMEKEASAMEAQMNAEARKDLGQYGGQPQAQPQNPVPPAAM